LELISSMTKDAVATFLDVSYVERVVAEVTEQAVVPVRVEAVTEVTKRLKFSEEEVSGVLDHFIRGGQTTAGGVMNAVTSFSQEIRDVERAYEVEALGMDALALAAKA
jgi:hypothetical protein